MHTRSRTLTRTALTTLAALLAVISLGAQQLHAAEALTQGDKIFIYDDGFLSGIAKVAKKELKEQLKKRKLKWISKSVKGGLLADLPNTIAKDVLKKKPTLVLLSFGMHDIYDNKKHTIKEYDWNVLKTALDTSIELLHGANITVMLATPGINGETLDAEHHTHINTFSDSLKAYAKEKGLKVCDIHTSALNWIRSNPPKKPGALQLSKKNGNWNKTGCTLLAPRIMAALGLSSSGITRPLQWNERILFVSGLADWQEKMDKQLELDIRAFGPQKAPKGAVMPGITGPKWIRYKTKVVDKSGFSIDAIRNQKPSIIFVHFGPHIILHTRELSTFTARLNTAISDIAALDRPTFLITPYLHAANPTDPLYIRSVALQNLIIEAGKTHDLPVIDFLSLCIQAKQHNSGKRNAIIVNPQAQILLVTEIKRALGMPIAED